VCKNNFYYLYNLHYSKTSKDTPTFGIVPSDGAVNRRKAKRGKDFSLLKGIGGKTRLRRSKFADAVRRHRQKLVGVIGVEPTTSDLANRRSWGLGTDQGPYPVSAELHALLVKKCWWRRRDLNPQLRVLQTLSANLPPPLGASTSLDTTKILGKPDTYRN
jgi:hypothetical protein